VRPLTVKLSGRAQAPDWSRGCKLSFCTRGDTSEPHGPLQRLLGARELCKVSRLKAANECSFNSMWKLNVQEGAVESKYA
jgi:hypothetical protein